MMFYILIYTFGIYSWLHKKSVFINKTFVTYSLLQFWSHFLYYTELYWALLFCLVSRTYRMPFVAYVIYVIHSKFKMQSQILRCRLQMNTFQNKCSRSYWTLWQKTTVNYEMLCTFHSWFDSVNEEIILFTYALRAPPPFAWLSNFVMITDPTSTFSLKALACASHACPIEASITNITLSGDWNQ